MIHDLLGREVVTLVSEAEQAGEHVVQWHGTGSAGETLPSGVYVARLVAGSQSAVVKLMLLK